MKHYLLSIELDGNFFIHGYVMLKEEDQNVLSDCMERMISSAKDHGYKSRLPSIALQTHLGKEYKSVRDIITKVNDGRPSRHWETKNFHFSAWFMSGDNPDTEVLMKLH